jgi:hypothetical protein
LPRDPAARIGSSGRCGAGGRRSVVRELDDFVLDPELLALKFGDPGFVGAGSVFLFGDHLIEVCMLGFQGVDMLRRGHAGTSFANSRDSLSNDANAVRRPL